MFDFSLVSCERREFTWRALWRCELDGRGTLVSTEAPAALADNRVAVANLMCSLAGVAFWAHHPGHPECPPNIREVVVDKLWQKTPAEPVQQSAPVAGDFMDPAMSVALVEAFRECGARDGLPLPIWWHNVCVVAARGKVRLPGARIELV